MNFHPLGALEEKESESAGDRAPGTGELPAVDTKVRDHVQEAGHALALREGRCPSTGDCLSVDLPIYSKNNIMLSISATLAVLRQTPLWIQRR